MFFNLKIYQQLNKTKLFILEKETNSLFFQHFDVIIRYYRD